MTGFPDWLVPVNISRQELAEITNRPKYGAAQIAFAAGTFASDAEETLLTITGLGQTYAGTIGFLGDASSLGSVLKILVDGTTLFNAAISSGITVGNFANHSDVAYLTQVDDILFKYYWGLSNEITFESSLVIKGKRQAGVSTQFAISIIYTIV